MILKRKLYSSRAARWTNSFAKWEPAKKAAKIVRDNPLTRGIKKTETWGKISNSELGSSIGKNLKDTTANKVFRHMTPMERKRLAVSVGQNSKLGGITMKNTITQLTNDPGNVIGKGITEASKRPITTASIPLPLPTAVIGTVEETVRKSSPKYLKATDKIGNFTDRYIRPVVDGAVTSARNSLAF